MMRWITFNMLLILSCFSMIFVSSCSDEEILLGELDDTYLVFGHFYGECFGEGCVETYALTSTTLYEDTNSVYGSTDFNFVALSMEQFELVKGLEDKFPSQLLEETEDVFGCPDCGDWGGIYVEYVKDGERMGWRIDTMLDDIPGYQREFVKEIMEKIELINQ